jgi:predicted DCC family thiol-disulfide oxidoreductase YuxK
VGPAVAGAAPAVLVYDGDCPSCRGSALRLLRRAQAGGATALEVLPCRSAERRRRHPAMADDACRQGMQLVLPDGRVLAGAEAVPEILRRVPLWRGLAGLLGLPGAGPLGRRACRWMATYRLRLICPRGR